MLDFADAYGEDTVESKTEKKEEEDGKRLEDCPSESGEECECAEAVEFLNKRARKRKSVGVSAKVDSIKNLSNIRLWRLYISLKDDNGRPRLRAVVREIIYERYLPDVLAVADAYSRRKLPVKSLARPKDVRQAAVVAHLEGIELYSPEYGPTYMQFINARGKSRLKGRIIDALRKLQHLPRDISRKRRDWKKRIEALTHKLRKNPTMEELYDEYGDEVHDIYNDRLFSSVVVNQIDDESDQTTIEDFAEDRKVGKSSFVEKSTASPARDAILRMIPNQKERFVIDAYYFKGMLCGDIASSLSCSTSTVSTLRRLGERVILSKMSKEEFEGLFK